MTVLKLVFLSFMGFCLCQDVTEDVDGLQFEVTDGSVAESTPVTDSNVETPKKIDPNSYEGQLAYMKHFIRFTNDQVLKRWLLTEELTCKEVYDVLKSLKANIESDLHLVMTDVRKHLKQVPRDRKTRNCIRFIEEEVELYIDEGVEDFTNCTNRITGNRGRVTEIQEKLAQNEKNTEQMLKDLDKCLEFNNINSVEHLRHCVKGILKVDQENVMAACETVSQSKCMAEFQNDILKCFSGTFDNITEKKTGLKEEIRKCVGYVHLNPESENYTKTIPNILSHYTNVYKMLSREYDLKTLGYYAGIYELLAEQEYLSYNSIKKLTKFYFGQYYYALEKTVEENHSGKTRKCADSALANLNELIEQGNKDVLECNNFSINESRAGIAALINITTEFNSKFSQAGNVALLRCFSQRPRQIFGIEAIESCVNLAKQSLHWNLDVVNWKLKNATSMDFYPELLPNGKTCHELRFEKLEMDANKILDNCTRCIYGGSGDNYAVTTPIPVTVTVDPIILETFPPVTDTNDYEDEVGFTEVHYESDM